MFRPENRSFVRPYKPVSRLDKGPILGRNVTTSLFDVAFSSFYEFVKITLNSLGYNTGQHHMGAKKAV